MVDGGSEGWVITDTSSSEQARRLTDLTQQPGGAERFRRAGPIWGGDEGMEKCMSVIQHTKSNKYNNDFKCV